MSGSMNTHDDQKITLTISNSTEQQIDLDCKEEVDTSNEQSTEDNTSVVGTMNEDSRRNDDCMGNEVPTTGQYYEQQHEHNFEAMTTSSAPLQEVGSKQDGSQDTTNKDVDGIILKDDRSISIPSADELRNGNTQKEKIETTSSLPKDGNDTTVQNSNTTDDTIFNRTTEGNESSTKAKKVSFAPINKLRKFDTKCIVSSSLQVNESNVELLASHSGNQRRRPVKRILRHTRLRLVPTSVGIYKALMKSEETDDNDDTDELLFPSITDSIYSDSISTQNQQSVGKRNTIQVALLHSHSHTQILYQAMKYIHQDRDLLLESLLKWCGILHGASNGGALSTFLRVIPPLIGTRKLLETFHSSDYLDVLEYVPEKAKKESSTVESTQQQSLTDEVDQNMTTMNEDSLGIHHSSSKECTSPTNDSSTADMNDHQSTFTSQTKFYETPFSPPPPEDESSYIDIPSQEILEKYGLEDDCPYPTSTDAHALLWKYCLAASGGSWHAATLLTSSEEPIDVAIHWGGGRHHAHASKASGFCYISDVIPAIHRLLQGNDKQIDTGMMVHKSTNAKSVQRNVSFRRVLYIDIDIHHGDGVQEAFYATDKVLTASFHRYSPGFFPSSSGSTTEKGEVGTSGLGYNVNIPLPAGIGDVQFIQIYRKCLFGLVKTYDPQAIVLCVGADGLEGDELISGCLDDDMTTSGDGWSLSPEGLAECVRIATALCAGQSEDEICVAPTAQQQQEEKASEDDTPVAESSTKTEAPKQSGKRRKLLLLGGGGYTASQTARTHLLCTAAACEGARPGMLWEQLPRDIPSHEYFPRYGPLFELVSETKKEEIFASYSTTSSTTNTTNTKDDKEEGSDKQLDMSAADKQTLKQAHRTIELATLYIDRQKEKKTPTTKSTFSYNAVGKDDDATWLETPQRKKKSSNNKGGGRRKKKRKPETVEGAKETRGQQNGL